jgi:hypothetical protein
LTCANKSERERETGRTDVIAMTGRTDVIAMTGRTDVIAMTGRTDVIAMTGRTDVIAMKRSEMRKTKRASWQTQGHRAILMCHSNVPRCIKPQNHTKCSRRSHQLANFVPTST